MIYKWPRGQCIWAEYFMYRFFGITIYVERFRENGLRSQGIQFAAQQKLPAWAGTLHVDCAYNHMGWRHITVMFRHVHVGIHVWKNRVNTGFPTGGWSWPPFRRDRVPA